MGCVDAYNLVIEKCPAEIFDPQSSECDVSKITDECIDAASQLEGWYCTCKNNFEYMPDSNQSILVEMNDTEKHSCLKYHRIFTHNSCIKQKTSGGPTPIPGIIFGQIFDGIPRYYSGDAKFWTVTKKCHKKCNRPGDFLVLLVFLAVFFRTFDKKSQNVTVRE